MPVSEFQSFAQGCIYAMPQQEPEGVAEAGTIPPFELEKRLEAALHDRVEHIRQRDELAHQLAELTQSGPELATQLEEARKQLVSARRARNAAQARIHELTDKLAASEDRAADLEWRLESAEQERGIASQQAAKFMRERDDLQRTVLDSAKRHTAAVRDLQAHASALVDTQKQLVRISRERDTARATAEDEAQQIADLDTKLKALTEKAAVQASNAAQIDALQQTIKDLEGEAERLRLLQREAVKQLAETKRNRDAAVGAIVSAYRQVEFLTCERDLMRLEAPEPIGEKQAKVIEFASFETAREKNREVSVGLAGTDGDGDALLAPAPGFGLAASGPEPAVLVSGPMEEGNPSKALAVELGELRSLFHEFRTHMNQIDLLERLCLQATAFAECARLLSLSAAATLATALAECFQWLHSTPNRISLDVLGGIERSLDVICLCAEAGALPRLKDPRTSVVYVIDGDADNCECVSAALSRFVDRTKYALRPSVALAELGSGEYDLILLDVNLPEMDGFELCRRIRTLDHQAHTAIIFLSEAGSEEMQAKVTAAGGNDLLCKPFDLHELMVHALTQTIRAQI